MLPIQKTVPRSWLINACKMNDLHTVQTLFQTLEEAAQTQLSQEHAWLQFPEEIKATFVPARQNMAAILTKGPGSHRTH